MSPRSDAPNYVLGQKVFGGIDGCPGVVTSVDDKFDTFIVQWDGHDFPVVYPGDTIMVRKGMPWE
jgi:hypothetical protein